jgi:hypothetical protein
MNLWLWKVFAVSICYEGLEQQVAGGGRWKLDIQGRWKLYIQASHKIVFQIFTIFVYVSVFQVARSGISVSGSMNIITVY